MKIVAMEGYVRSLMIPEDHGMCGLWHKIMACVVYVMIHPNEQAF